MERNKLPQIKTFYNKHTPTHTQFTTQTHNSHKHPTTTQEFNIRVRKSEVEGLDDKK